MFHLVDTFNGRTLSRHRTEEAAERANEKLQKALKKQSAGSYLPTVIAEDYPDGPGIYLAPGRYFGVGELAPVGYEPPAQDGENMSAEHTDGVTAVAPLDFSQSQVGTPPPFARVRILNAQCVPMSLVGCEGTIIGRSDSGTLHRVETATSLLLLAPDEFELIPETESTGEPVPPTGGPAGTPEEEAAASPSAASSTGPLEHVAFMRAAARAAELELTLAKVATDLQGPSAEPAADQWRSSASGKSGGHYNIFVTLTPETALEFLRAVFPAGEANEMNFVLFSTSGVHGTYSTIEESWPPEPDEETGETHPAEVTFLLVQPRIVGMTYGNVRVGSDDDAEFLKRLRKSSWRVVQEIGRATP